jgi:DNA-binding NtrC family response regulator
VAHLLVVDDDSDLTGLISRQLSSAGHEVKTASSVGQARKLLQSGSYDILLTDLEMPDGTGIDLLKTARETDPNLVVILLTGHATVDTAVEAMKLGAFDYLRKPFPAQELLVVIEKGAALRELVQENRLLRGQLREKYKFPNLVGNSPAMQAVLRLAEKVGPTSSTVLLLGESGTGKELVARAIHEVSPRAHRRCLKINCSALTESLLESELFGYERGAFTGAVATHQGLFEAAHGGTLFLDEVGDTPPSLQAKLLRVLQESEIRRVGGTADIPVDVRILAATNRNLRERVQQGIFREDLFFRLNVVSIPLPSLRERREDIPLLVNHLIQKKGEALGRFPHPSREVMEIFLTYPWPGNVRELENAIERALILCEGDMIETGDLPEELRGLNPHTSIQTMGGHSSREIGIEDLLPLEEIERRHVLRVLDTVKGHREEAAKILQVSRRTLYNKIQRWKPDEETQ